MSTREPVNGPDAVDRLFAENVGLAYIALNRFVGRLAPGVLRLVGADELESEALYRFLYCLQHFDASRGFKLSAYACVSIDLALRTLVRERLAWLNRHASLEEVWPPDGDGARTFQPAAPQEEPAYDFDVVERLRHSFERAGGRLRDLGRLLLAGRSRAAAAKEMGVGFRCAAIYHEHLLALLKRDVAGDGSDLERIVRRRRDKSRRRDERRRRRKAVARA